jgi:hypothetical protein
MNPAVLAAFAKLGIAGLAIGALLYVVKMNADMAREDRIYNTQKILEQLVDVEQACKGKR